MSRSYKKHGFSTMCSSYGDKWCRNYYHRCERRKTKAILKKQIDFERSNVKCSYKRFYEEEPADTVINENVDYSLEFSDKWSWSSDGGNYFRDNLLTLRGEFDKEVFGDDCYYFSFKHNSKRKDKTVWEKYALYREKVLSNKKRMYIVTFFYKKRVGTSVYKIGKSEVTEPIYEETRKQIKVGKHPSKIKFENDGWYRMTFWKERANYYHFSDWFLLEFLFKRNIIPLSFNNSEELISWLRENEEEIIRKWFLIKYKK